MILVIAKNIVKKDCIQKFIEATKELIIKTKAEVGCIDYNLYQDKDNLSLFTFVEKWESEEALNKHIASEHFKRIVPSLKDLKEVEGDLSILNTVNENTVSSNIFKRKSVRKFIDKPVEKTKIENILKAAMQSPTAHNTQAWEFIVVRDKKALLDTSKMSPYARPLETAAAAIIVCVNLNTIKDMKILLEQDLGACTENILLQIVDEGLGGVWLCFYPDEDRVSKIKEYYKLPEHVIPFSVIPFGYVSDDTDMSIKLRYDVSKVHYDKY